MFRIGEFSKMAKVSVKTLRYYDEVGLLKPYKVDGFNKYRYYSYEQLSVLVEIMSYRDIGLPIEDIHKILDGNDGVAILSEYFDRLEKEKETVTYRMMTTSEMIGRMRTMGDSHKACIKEFPACIVYSKTGRVADFSEFPKFIMGSAEECLAVNPGLECAKPDFCYVAYLDEEYRDKDILIEYAQSVVKKGIETETIKFKDLPASKAVCVMHKGPYKDIGLAYKVAYRYIEENGLKAYGYPREQYIDGVWNKDDESEYLTEVQILIE